MYVRPICTTGDTGLWTRADFATTPCASYAGLAMYDTSATATTTTYCPANSFFRYGYSQVVYDSAMLADAGFSAGSENSALTFHPNNMSGNAFYTNCRVFMKGTAKTAFTANDDFDTVSSADLVYTGDLNWDAIGWRPSSSTAPSCGTASSSVLIAIDRDHGRLTRAAPPSAP